MTEEKINRINELYHKSKSEGLTAKEKEEQDILRKEYIMSMKKNLTSTLNNVSIVNPDGSISKVSKKKNKTL